MQTVTQLILLAQENQEWGWFLIVAGLLGLFLLMAFILVLVYGKLWFQAYMSGADVSLASLIGMTFRQVNPRVIVTAKVMAAQAGLEHRSARRHLDAAAGGPLSGGWKRDGRAARDHRRPSRQYRSGF